jgi:hypothetical protein
VQHGAKTVTTGILNQHKGFINYFHAFQINRNLTKHLKINNMRFMNLMVISDVLQVQGIKRDYLIKDDYFSKHE